MIEIPIHNERGEQVDTLAVDEALLGGEVRPDLLKQAYVRYHANQRQGTVQTKSRADTAYSTRKLYRQKGTGNARRGSAGTNLMRKGGMAFAKKPKSWRLKMPDKMRRLANRNAILAKAVDGEIKLVDQFSFEKPSTRQFAALLEALEIDRTCLLALGSTSNGEARSAANHPDITLTRIDQLNAFNLLNHRYLLADKATFQAWLDVAAQQAGQTTEAK